MPPALVGTRLAGRWLDPALALSLAVVAGWLRLGKLVEVPLITDETEEVRRALAVARGHLLPLTDVDSYIGAWNVYLTAVALRLFGPRLDVARGVTLVAAALTVAATYWLARELKLGRTAAGLAAGFLAASAAHVVVGSHVAWSNCTTPLYTTLAAACVAAALRRDDPRWLPAAGLAGGLALQTHPTALPPLLALAAWGLWGAARRGWLRRSWPWLGLAAFLVAYSPLIVFNLSSGFHSIVHAQEIRNDYEHGHPLSPSRYLMDLGALGIGAGQLLGSSFVPTEGALADPDVWLAAALALAALAWGARRGLCLPLLASAVTVLLLPLFTHKYNLVMNGRYLLPLLPPVLVAEAAWLATLATAGGVWLHSPGARARGVAGTALLIVVGLAVGWSLFGPPARLQAYEQQATHPSHNAALLRLVAAIDTKRRPDEAVLLDQRLFQNPNGYPRDPGRRLQALRVLFDLAGTPDCSVVADTRSLSYARDSGGGRTALLVTTPGVREIGSFFSPLPGVGQMLVSPEDRLDVYRVPVALSGRRDPGVPGRTVCGSGPFGAPAASR
jgi:4-amino-4-deoxy-L-arabinose transferase-like glycosyltransferase